MRLKLYIPRDAPPEPWQDELIELDTAAIPYMLGALWTRSQKYHWTDATHAQLGRSMLCKQGAQMLMGATKEIVGAVDRLYRLTDAIHNGIVYTVSGAGTELEPYIYNPSMPIVPYTVPGSEPGVKFSLEKMLRLSDNMTNGTTYADAPDDRNIRQQIEDLIAAVEARGNLDDETLAKLAEILVALA